MRQEFFRISFSIIILSFFINLNAQEEASVRKFFVEADSYFLFEEYSEALPLYQRILREEPDNCNVLYKIGICYLNNPYQKNLSIDYLLKASKSINPSYKPNSHKEQGAPPETYFYLGQAYRVNGNFNKALEYFNLFKIDLNAEVFDISIVNEEIASCENAKKMVKNPVFFQSKSAGNKINSRFAETNPVISGDGNTMIFTRALQFYDAVFITKKDSDGNWSEPYNLTPDFGLDGNSYSTGISYNGDEIYVYRSDNYDGNIYTSKLVNNKWTKLEKLNSNINTKYWESHASPSPDGKFLFFTSNRKGGYGGLDIYKAPRLADGKWGFPENLGPIINSPYNDDTPFISADGDKLFFSSLNHNSMGGYDLFVSDKKADGSWGKPLNMGYPLNSPDDDMFFVPSPDPNVQGIMSRYDENKTRGLEDIFQIFVYNELLPRTFLLSGKVNTPSATMLLNNRIKVSLLDGKTGEIEASTFVDSDGDYRLKAKQGKYQLLIEGDDIKTVSLPIELKLTQKDTEVNIPVVNAQILEPGSKAPFVETPGMPKLEIIGNEYILTDSVPVVIELRLNEGDDLNVETFLNDKLNKKEEYLITKEKFLYSYNPLPGKNTLVFTVRDRDGNTNQKEVVIFYKPKEEETLTQHSDSTKPANIDDITIVAYGKLKDYLQTVDSIEYNNLEELYNHLLSETAENGFTEEELNELFSILLSQKELDKFISELKNYKTLSFVYNNDSLIKSSVIPLALVRKVKNKVEEDKDFIDLELINVVPEVFGLNKLKYIGSFSDLYRSTSKQSKSESNQNIIKLLTESLTEEQASVAIELAATTRELEQFYQDLLASSGTKLKEELIKVDFDSLNIINSIDLVEYLFNLAEQGVITTSEVINTIEKAQRNKLNNINRFKEALASVATGELKVSIQEIDIFGENIDSYSELIDRILNTTKTKGYGRAEVYNLLITMIGINDVNEFIDALLKYASGDLKTVLLKIRPNQFSKPIEVIQYLISEASNYNYTETDINNLLIRLLLEKGLETWIVDQAPYSQKYINRSKIYTSLVILSFILIILIILFRNRKKKKEDSENDHIT